MDGKVAAEDTAQEIARRSAIDGGDEGRSSTRSRRARTRPVNEKGESHDGHATGTASRARQRAGPGEADEFAALLKQNFKPRSERAASEVENAVQTLVTQALADSSLVKGDVHRHDRGDDRAARREAHGADERDPARAGVPAAGERLARPALSRLQFRDRRDAEDPRHERRQDRALSQSQALSRRALGPEPAVQEDLRKRVRPARRRALWRADRRLSLQPFADRRAAAARSLERSPRRRWRR